MPATPEHHDNPPTLRDLYPHFTEEQSADAEDRFDRYIALALRIFDRLRNDPMYPEGFDSHARQPYDEAERSTQR